MTNRIAISVVVIIMTILLMMMCVTTHRYTYAQLPGISPPSSQDQQQQLQSQQSQNSSSSTSSNTSFVTFNDPQGRFSINYPSNWTAKTATNRFEKTLVSFTVGHGTPKFAEVDVQIPVNGAAPLGLEESIKGLASALSIRIPNFDLNQDVECQKYKLDGNQACSIIYTRTQDYTSNIQEAIMLVISEVNGKTYSISYWTLPDNFDKLLPTVNQMIRSFKSGT